MMYVQMERKTKYVNVNRYFIKCIYKQTANSIVMLFGKMGIKRMENYNILEIYCFSLA